MWALFPLMGVAIGVGAVALGERTSTRMAGGFVIIFASVLTVLAQLGLWQQYQRLQRDFRDGQFSDVEGRVENFQSDSKTESFSIGGLQFYILKPTITAAYSGGADLNHQCVRIFYTDRQEIVWLAARKSGCDPIEAPPTLHKRAADGILE